MTTDVYKARLAEIGTVIEECITNAKVAIISAVLLHKDLDYNNSREAIIEDVEAILSETVDSQYAATWLECDFLRETIDQVIEIIEVDELDDIELILEEIL